MPLTGGKPPGPPTNDLAYRASEKSRLGKVESRVLRYYSMGPCFMKTDGLEIFENQKNCELLKFFPYFPNFVTSGFWIFCRYNASTL